LVTATLQPDIEQIAGKAAALENGYSARR